MNAKRTFGALRWVAVAGLALAALAGCSGSATPRLIGSFPRDVSPTPFAPQYRAYDTRLEVEVADVEVAAQQAVQLAIANGGYLTASQSWYQDGGLRTSLTLVLPGAQFEAVRRSIVALGRLVDEHLTSQPAPWPPYSAQPPATLSVIFSTARPPFAWPVLPDASWSPARAFSEAFAVFTSLLVVLIDVVIWVSVVVGPFVLMGLGLRWLIRRVASHH